MIGMPLGCPWGPFFSSSAPARFWFVVGAAVPTQLFAARFGLHLAHPGSPKAPSESQNVPFFTIKLMILQSRLFAKSAL